MFKSKWSQISNTEVRINKTISLEIGLRYKNSEDRSVNIQWQKRGVSRFEVKHGASTKRPQFPEHDDSPIRTISFTSLPPVVTRTTWFLLGKCNGTSPENGFRTVPGDDVTLRDRSRPPPYPWSTIRRAVPSLFLSSVASTLLLAAN